MYYYIYIVDISKIRHIRARIVWRQYDALQKARRGLKEFKMSHLWTIQLLGEAGRLRMCEAMRITGDKSSTISSRFVRAAGIGICKKDGTHWVLTDTGRNVYDTLNRTLAAGMEEIVQSLMEEARRRL